MTFTLFIIIIEWGNLGAENWIRIRISEPSLIAWTSLGNNTWAGGGNNAWASHDKDAWASLGKDVLGQLWQ